MSLDSKASTDSPLPKPCNWTFSTLLSPKVSFWDRLNKMVLLTPVSKIKESSFPLMSIGSTIRLLMSLNFTRSFACEAFINRKPAWQYILET